MFYLQHYIDTCRGKFTSASAENRTKINRLSADTFTTSAEKNRSWRVAHVPENSKEGTISRDILKTAILDTPIIVP